MTDDDLVLSRAIGATCDQYQHYTIKGEFLSPSVCQARCKQIISAAFEAFFANLTATNYSAIFLICAVALHLAILH